MNQGGLGNLDVTKPETVGERPPLTVERLTNDELSPLDIEILDVVNEINRLEPLMKVPMPPSQAEKIEADLIAALKKKEELLDQKFKAATTPAHNTEGPIQTGDLTSLRLNRDRTDSAGNPLQ